MTPIAHADLFADLAAPFEAREVKTRSQSGRAFHYITARVAMNRLDDVLGPAGWWDDYVPGENSVLCRLTIQLPDGTLLTKSDAGGYAGMADSGDDDKSGYSDAFKRACVKFGIARYLYRDGVPLFAQDRFGGEVPNEPAPAAEPSHHERGRYEDAERRAIQEEPRSNGHANGHGGGGNSNGYSNGNGNGNGRDDRGGAGGARQDGGAPPRSGKALFAWTKEQEQRHQIGLLNFLNAWAKLQEFPGRMIDWNADQVSLGHKEAMRKLQSVQGSAAGDSRTSGSY